MPSPRKLTEAQLAKLREYGINYPWSPRHSLDLIERFEGFPKPDHVYRFGDKPGPVKDEIGNVDMEPMEPCDDSWSFMVLFRAGPRIKSAKVVTGEKAERVIAAMLDNRTGEQHVTSAEVVDGDHQSAFERAWRLMDELTDG